MFMHAIYLTYLSVCMLLHSTLCLISSILLMLATNMSKLLRITHVSKATTKTWRRTAHLRGEVTGHPATSLGE